MKLSRTKEYNFGWLVLLALVDLVFLLVFFLLLSSNFILQVVSPPSLALLPPPARVSSITSATEEGRTLLRWIDAEDPALAFTTQRPPQAKLRALPRVAHLPSYVAVESALKEIPPPDL